MNCPHVNEYEQCQDCPDYPCAIITPHIVETIMEQDKAQREADTCDSCAYKRMLADLVHRYMTEEAVETADSDGEYHELHCGRKS